MTRQESLQSFSKNGKPSSSSSSFLFVHPRHRTHALHGLPPFPLSKEFLPVRQGWGWAFLGLQFRPVGVKEPASPGKPDLHQPAEQ
ncbi:hypothetical protein KUCAC02_028764 [Chaenocephalus aceratus]|uniref:Uncharacterized protein n=1 Tax=Chaenocephalus aceratus TaxID=36190 RepID=A0ACB9X2Z9_CHAAC|nr:hypothetical protein KUCAC02_028764 [Chaenocephalus aceratus]